MAQATKPAKSADRTVPFLSLNVAGLCGAEMLAQALWPTGNNDGSEEQTVDLTGSGRPFRHRPCKRIVNPAFRFHRVALAQERQKSS